MFSDEVKHLLLKDIQIHSVKVLNFIYIVVIDVETALESAKVSITEQLELKIFFTLSQCSLPTTQLAIACSKLTTETLFLLLSLSRLMPAGHGGGRLGNFSQENFSVFYQNQNVVHNFE